MACIIDHAATDERMAVFGGKITMVPLTDDFVSRIVGE